MPMAPGGEDYHMPLRLQRKGARERDTDLAGVSILTVSGGYQRQKWGLFPFNPPLEVTLTMVKQ